MRWNPVGVNPFLNRHSPLVTHNYTSRGREWDIVPARSASKANPRKTPCCASNGESAHLACAAGRHENVPSAPGRSITTRQLRTMISLRIRIRTTHRSGILGKLRFVAVTFRICGKWRVMGVQSPQSPATHGHFANAIHSCDDFVCQFWSVDGGGEADCDRRCDGS